MKSRGCQERELYGTFAIFALETISCLERVEVLAVFSRCVVIKAVLNRELRILLDAATRPCGGALTGLRHMAPNAYAANVCSSQSHQGSGPGCMLTLLTQHVLDNAGLPQADLHVCAFCI